MDLRTLRKQSGLTIEELSDKTGLSQKVISRYERGYLKLPKETEEMLLKAAKQ